MQMSYREIQATCDDFNKFMEEHVDRSAFAAVGDFDDVISLTVEEARKHGIVTEKKSQEG